MNRLIYLLLLLFPFSLIAQKKDRRPNIIVILADDLGYGDVGCYGQQKIETPNIDRLARMGTRFTQFYSGTSVCAPARCSFMTGLHTGHTPVRGNMGMKPEGQYPLPDSSITFPMLLQKQGYHTAAFGKWGLGYITTSGDPNKKGFDEFYGYNCQSLAHNYYPDHLWNNHEKIDLSINLSSDSVYSADLIHSQAMKFLEEKQDKPFFLYLPYTIPHADVIVPHDSVYDYYVKKFGGKSELHADKAPHFDPNPHAAFAAMVSRLDSYVGEIMNTLAAKGMEENTLLIFTSDNGPHRERGGDPVFFNSSGPNRGIKRDLYEGGIRVPFIAYRKGFTKAGSTFDQPVALWDLFPTFLEMAGRTTSKNIDGISILPALKGQKQKLHNYLYWEFHENGGRQAIRMGNWKAVKLNVSTTDNPPIELYDLGKDPGEENNVAAANPAIVKKMQLLFKEAHRYNPVFPLLKTEQIKANKVTPKEDN